MRMNWGALRRLSFIKYFFHISNCLRLGGATVARLTPDQKVAGSNPVRVIFFYLLMQYFMPFFAFVLYVCSNAAKQLSKF